MPDHDRTKRVQPQGDAGDSVTRISEDRGAAPAPPSGLPVTPTKYSVLSAIGRGGMGEVLLVHDAHLRRDVAMKVIRADLAGDENVRRKFIAEAQATSQLDHPSIPPVYEMGTRENGDLYFTLRLVRGRTLKQVLRDLMLGVREVRLEYTPHRLVSIVERVAEGVQYAHERNVLHRDLKPENVMLGSHGEVQVMDWGLAKITESTHTTGTPERSSPVDAVATHDSDKGIATQAGTVQGTIP